MNNQIIAIIPARGNSKSIPNKNLIDFCGKPLLAWSILQALDCSLVDEVYVSSDSEEILKAAKVYGAHGIKRPSELATDTATSESALLHAIDHIESFQKKKIDVVVFLQATSPLREPKDIDGAIRTFFKTDSDSMFSMAILEDFCVWARKEGDLRGITFDPLNRGRRQNREPVYLENGSIYVLHPQILRGHNNRLGGKISMFEMPFWKSYEIDTFEDIEICKYYFKKKLLLHWIN